MEGDALLLLNNRLANRRTYLDWNKTIMGPIIDEHGVEQGGINSSDFNKLYNNEFLETLQKSCQGVQMGSKLTISAVLTTCSSAQTTSTCCTTCSSWHLSIARNSKLSCAQTRPNFCFILTGPTWYHSTQ